MKTILLVTAILFNLSAIAVAATDLPVENGVITSGVGLRVDPFGSGKLVFHRGIDIAVPVGTPVRSIRKGRVVFAGVRSGYGSTVIVEHANGDRTLYGHNSLVRVSSGELVESGTVVAFSGNTGRSTGPHVHFEQLPSDRPNIEPVKTEEANIPQLVNNDDQRDVFEQRMEESVNSVLRTINHFSQAGQGG
ncbi:MAG: M23 family metallopeptidase [Rhodoferax sp.]|uniref:M23 family metallopeptidase n=1 Tax=Rhodoferax sp. TaxID=50421 RepID=UPI00260BA5B2|nr:M23 family metallopeptidase [Rhodoferax sp.]MDD2883220.1 M23 family metallopeptidase [Rhodoferax sp.]